MIRSAVKKKIEASATITNTMIVVIMVSRRVGQVTLAVSERTSCRNLNGLKAIAVPRPLRDESNVRRENRTTLAQACFGPTLSSKDEPAGGLDCSGISIAAPDIRSLSGPAAGGGYLTPDGPKVKAGGGEIKGLADKNGWQEWQGSNLRPPVLET